jgi:UrcA family protein
VNAIRKSLLITPVAASAVMLGLAGMGAPQSRAADAAAATVRVHIGDLDARSPAGAERIFWRLEHASEQVCGDFPAATQPLYMTQSLRSCEQKAIAPAVVRINTTPLKNVYYQHYTQPLGSVTVGPIAIG